MRTTADLEASAADLRSRIELLRARISRINPRDLTARSAQQFNIEDLQDQLADVERLLSGRQAVRPADLSWYLPGSRISVMGTSTVCPWIGTRRKGQAVRWLGTPNGKKPTVRARVADNYEILVDGAPVSTGLLTRREAGRQAHVGAAGAIHAGRVPEALRLRGRALARFLFRNRPGGRSNRKARKAEKRRRAKIRTLVAVLEISSALQGTR